jgi:hypothetical protein
MLDLKGPLDVMNAAEAAWKKQAAEIANLLSLGTDEATQQALALQSTLDTLQADYEAKKDIYTRLVQVNAPSDVAKLFIPSDSDTSQKSATAKSMSLAEYNNLPPKERLAFAKSGGEIN